MITESKCPKCGGAMFEGYILDRTYGGKLQSAWVEGEPEKSFWVGLKTGDRDVFNVQALRCGSCNYLEVYTTEKVEISNY